MMGLRRASAPKFIPHSVAVEAAGATNDAELIGLRPQAIGLIGPRLVGRHVERSLSVTRLDADRRHFLRGRRMIPLPGSQAAEPDA